MASNIFGRYVWLIDTLRQEKRLTFKEIDERWRESGLNYGDNYSLPLRTFHNHRKAIKDIFDVCIECDRQGGNYYYIDNPQQLVNDGFRNWLIDSYAALNQLQVDKQLMGRIVYEHNPSGNMWLITFAQAMRRGKVVQITHRGFGRTESKIFEIEPYYLRIFRQRWYVIGKNIYFAQQKQQAEREGKTYDNAVFRVYGLDRISNVTITQRSFTLDNDFSINDYYDGCYGIIPDVQIDKEHVVIRAFGTAADYFRTLPLHESQKEIESAGDTTLFSLDVRPTLDFYQQLLSRGDQIEVVEPISVRKCMKTLIKSMLRNYKKGQKYTENHRRKNEK